MKFIDFVKKYYDVSHRNFKIEYSYEEKKILEKNIFERRSYDTVPLLASERKNAIRNSYIFFIVFYSLIIIFSFINIKFLWLLLPTTILSLSRFTYLDFSIINIFIYYLLYLNSNNVFKELLKDNFDKGNIINDIVELKQDIFFLSSGKKFSLIKLKYKIFIKNALFINLIIKRKFAILKTKNQKLIIKDKTLTKKEIINKIKNFIQEQKIDQSNKQFEWVLLKKVNYKEKFEVYGCVVSLNKCICENKIVGVNVKNQYNIKKAIKYRFNNECINNKILVSKINDNEYVVFVKEIVNR